MSQVICTYIWHITEWTWRHVEILWPVTWFENATFCVLSWGNCAQSAISKLKKKIIQTVLPSADDASNELRESCIR